ncbi:hypothetical protein CEUSTIGMA_g3086.t1 [Chlamydomonas eustigma]|uniref:Uncharacterized protein n=1 Tax=Chlamydomonas eustigma TaxID=1157962 RepID=A0A250WYG1_9CHLO|nr:hypothetical protein CEUSTIGMA_g3086.t1 [Chlamydomonas eustigma]|eukprot:GAX75642.1 hypothetical protein CEUSTIGMA_g3086.t1 [Chlamydomonas eustigma]
MATSVQDVQDKIIEKVNGLVGPTNTKKFFIMHWIFSHPKDCLPSLMNEISQESYPTLLQKAINYVGPQKYSMISNRTSYLNNPISSSPHLEGLETSNLGLVQRLRVGKENIKGGGEKEGIWQSQREEGEVLSVHNNKLKSE